MKKKQMELRYPKGQTARLQKSIRRLKVSAIIGFVMLLAAYVSDLNYAKTAKTQVDNTVYLNQYKSASKLLTDSARLYAVTKNESYYDTYYKELNEAKMREQSLELLENSKLSSAERAQLETISRISDQLVPVEEQAMKLVKGGNGDQALEILFGADYEKETDMISQKISVVTSEILTRLESQKLISGSFQLFFNFLFFVSFLIMMYNGTKTIRFSEKEILEPVLDVSEQMDRLAAGKLHTTYQDVTADSEVGQMLCSIENMKKNMGLMIGELSEVLEKIGDGNYVIQLEQDYIGDFSQIKDSIQKIVERMKKSLETVQIVISEINSSAENLTSAADSLADACTSQAGQVSDIMLLTGELREIISDNEKQAEEAVKISKCSEEMLLENQKKAVELQNKMKEVAGYADVMLTVTEKVKETVSETAMLLQNGELGLPEENVQMKKLVEYFESAEREMSQSVYKTVEAIQTATELSDSSNNNMEEVIICSNETSERLENIVSRLQGEVSTIAMIDDNVAEVAGVVDNNSATAQETAAISEEQQAQVETLVQLLENYKM